MEVLFSWHTQNTPQPRFFWLPSPFISWIYMNLPYFWKGGCVLETIELQWFGSSISNPNQWVREVFWGGGSSQFLPLWDRKKKAASLQRTITYPPLEKENHWLKGALGGDVLVPSTVVSRDFRLEPEYMVTAGELYPNSKLWKEPWNHLGPRKEESFCRCSLMENPNGSAWGSGFSALKCFKHRPENWGMGGCGGTK